MEMIKINKFALKSLEILKIDNYFRVIILCGNHERQHSNLDRSPEKH